MNTANRFKKKNQHTAEISTASLPDIVFLLLFFFMVSATIKTKEEMITVEIPKAQALTKVDQKSLLREISIGLPKSSRYGSSPSIEAGGRIISLEELPQWGIEQREQLPEAQKDQMIILLRADEHVSMGLVSDVQEKLKEINARKILYRTLKETGS
ncbi:MAG: biopolymer transporter ExbD [Marinoscillum sp.]|uniref:ExbD/TolR family protein n=2 Tax=Marinoscillum sp. TaxID=2024838 RepID=UPI0032FFEF19